MNKEYNHPLTLPETEPERTGYIFRGWAADSAAKQAVWGPGQSFELNGNTTLYAVWDRGEPEEYLKWKLYRGGAVVTGFRHRPDVLYIPCEIDGYAVTGIGTDAFRNCATLTEIGLPGSVTQIGYRAFQGCVSLETAVLSDSLTQLGAQAFDGCEALAAVSLPAGIAEIPDEVFRNCASLRSAVLPAGLDAIGRSAFAGCASLQAITLPDTLTSLREYVFSGCVSLKNVTVPGGVKNVGIWAFGGCTGLESVTLCEGVEKIVYYAFDGCTALESVSLPSTLTLIDQNTFQNCSSLASVDLPDHLATIGNMAFYGCAALQSVTVPQSVRTIGQLAFGACEGLTDLVIEEGTQLIDSHAFRYCSSLRSVWLPGSVVNIKPGAFSDCPSLRSVSVPEGGYAHQWMQTNLPQMTLVLRGAQGAAIQYGRDANGNIVSAAVPAGMTELPDYVFQGMTRLVSVTLPEGLVSIGSHAFEECGALREIILPASLTSIGEYAFSECNSLTAVTIPDGVSSIGDHAFSGCDCIETVTLSEGLKTIGKYAFSDCIHVTGYDFPQGLRAIGENAFQDNYSITEIILPEGLTALGNEAFTHCHSLVKAVLPESLTVLEHSTFYYCSSLREVRLGSGVTGIPSSLFYQCSALDGLVIPPSVTAIGSGAFHDCESLSSINLPAGITKIEESTFFGCESLRTVTIPEGVTELWGYAFTGCSALESLTIPASVTSFEQGAIFPGNGTALRSTPNLIHIYTPEGSPARAWLAERYADRGFIIEDPVPVTGVTISHSLISLTWHSSDRLTASVTPANATAQGIVWTSSDPRAVSVDQTGLVTALLPSATATVTASAMDGSRSASCIVKVWKVTKSLLYECDGGTVETQKTSVVIGPGRTFGELPVPVKENALFLGWFSGPDAGAARITADTPVGSPETSITLYARWRPASVPAPRAFNMGNGTVYLSWTDACEPDLYRVYETSDSGRVLLTAAGEKYALLEQAEDGPHTYLIAGVYGAEEVLSEPVAVTVGQMRVTVTLTPGNYSGRRSLPEDFIALLEECGGVGCVSADPATAYAAGGLAIGLRPGTTVLTLTVHGYPAVCAVEAIALENELTLPAALGEIGEEAFCRNTALESVLIPDGVTVIGERAFWCCTNLRAVWIPEGVAVIGEHAFDGCPLLCVYCRQGSFAQTYAEEHGLSVFAD